MTATARRTHIRWFIRRDMQEVLAIEAASFAYPWDEDAFVRVLRQRNCMGMVAEGDKDNVAGYFLYEFSKSRVECLNFAVHPVCQRQGIGTAMMARLKSKLDTQRRPSTWRRRSSRCTPGRRRATSSWR